MCLGAGGGGGGSYKAFSSALFTVQFTAEACPLKRKQKML